MIELKNIILSDKDPMLRKHSTDLDVNNIKPEEQYLIDMMVKYIDACYNDEAEKYGIKPGIAVASNQVGLFKKVVYVHFKINDKEHKYLIANPKITAYSYAIGYLSDGEGCLSVKNKHEGIVPRRNVPSHCGKQGARYAVRRCVSVKPSRHRSQSGSGISCSCDSVSRRFLIIGTPEINCFIHIIPITGVSRVDTEYQTGNNLVCKVHTGKMDDTNTVVSTHSILLAGGTGLIIP